MNEGCTVAEILQRVRKRRKDASSVLTLSERPLRFEALSTGLLPIDFILAGGWPKGRICQVYGETSSGKTSLALATVAATQQKGLACGYIDMEHTLDPAWAIKLGVDIDNLIISQPNCGEEALEVAADLIEEGTALVVVDSVPALVTEQELKGEVTDSSIAPQARMLSQYLRRMIPVISDREAVLLFINQKRMKMMMYTPGDAVPGGSALQFYSSVILRLSRRLPREDGCIDITARVTKHKLAPPFKETTVRLYFDRGFDRADLLATQAIALEVVVRRGAFYYFGDLSFQGRDALVAALNEDTTLFADIEQEVLNAFPRHSEHADGSTN